MGKKIKTVVRRAASRSEKLIKVPSEVHLMAKVKSAQRGKSIGKFIGELVSAA